MSELINKHDNRATIRWKLLTGASALTLMAYVSSAALANAEDSDRPQIWIEFGGQWNRLQDSQEIYTPPFVALTPSNFSPPQKAERPPLYGFDESGQISFQPKGSDWIFSASIHYGRAGSSKHERHQSYPTEPYISVQKFHRGFNGNTHHFTHYYSILPDNGRFTDAAVKQSESHAILDFQTGKDFGIGLFGPDSSSTLNVGVRFAQFTSKSRIKLKEDPDWHFRTNRTSFSIAYTYYSSYYTFGYTHLNVTQPYHSFSGSLRAKRSFKGLGPPISWNSSVPFAGNSQDGALTLDWGVNAALLFGRQKAKTVHQTTAQYGHAAYIAGHRNPYYTHGPYTHARSRRVTVPNVGGFAGISWQYANAKVSFGYKADFFFGAIDGGIDVRKNEDRAFYGPYASISIGLGD